MELTAEEHRLREARTGVPWRVWGPYLSERQWGTVREDYSDNGDAWSYFSHDQARSRAYRWGEDGLAGISDDKQRLCFALALWNERDPILKERLFGLTNAEGNHGEDVKEYYFYVDNLPTHTLPAVAVQVPAAPRSRTTISSPPTGRRSRAEMEYELLDTGVFDDDRYFDVEVELRQGRRRRHRRAASRSTTAVPRTRRSTCCRRCGSATRGRGPPHDPKPRARAVDGDRARSCAPTTTSSATWYLHAEPRRRAAVLRQRDRTRRACGAPTNAAAVPEGRHRRPRRRTGTPTREPRPATGTKVAAHVRLVVPGRRPATIVAAARPQRPTPLADPFADADDVIADAARRGRRVLRRDHAGRRRAPTPPRSCARRWPGCCGRSSRYYFDVDRLAARARRPTRCARPARTARATSRGSTWSTTTSSRCPTSGSTRGTRRGTWPSTASPLAMVDPDFAKSQLDLMLSQRVPPPDRADAGLRVELRRRQPAGARLRHAVHAQPSAGDRGRRRPAVPAGVVHPAAAQLHVVGQPQGPARARTCSRAASSASTTSACSTAARRCPPAGGSSRPTARLDGAVQPEHARAGARSSPSTTRATRTSCSSSSSTSSGSPPPSTPSATTPTRCGTRRTASSTTCCACPTAPGQRLKVRSLVGPAAAVRDDGHLEPDVLERFPRADATDRGRTSTATSDLLGQHRRPARARRQRPAAAVARQRGQAAPDPRRACSTRTASSARTASARSRGGPPRRPVRVRRRTATTYRVQYEPAESTTGMFGGNSNWRGPGVVPRQPADHPRPAAALPLLRRRLHDRVPDRLGPRDDAVRGGQGDRRPADRARSSATTTGDGRCTAAPSSSRTTRTGAT